MANIRIISVPGCPWCKKAVDLAVSIQPEGHTVEMLSLEWGEELREIQSKHAGWRTVPMVYVDVKFIGGYTDFEEYVKENVRQEEAERTEEEGS